MTLFSAHEFGKADRRTVACFLAVVAYIGPMVTLFFGMVRATATEALALHLFKEIRAAWSL